MKQTELRCLLFLLQINIILSRNMMQRKIRKPMISRKSRERLNVLSELTS